MTDATMIPEETSNLIVQGPRQRSAQWGDLMIALSKAQGEIEGAAKDSQNPHFKSSYADLASVWRAIREPLSKNGLAIMQWPRVSDGAVEIETIVAHGEQFISDVLWMPCSKMDAHGIGSAITYGRRYALMAVAGVAPEDDDGYGAVQGAPGSAGAGGEFRPAGRRTPPAGTGAMKQFAGDAQRDGLDTTRTKGALPKQGVGREATPEEARIAKFTTSTNKRIKALKEGPWTRETLKKFWDDDAKWRDWMADPTNEALEQYDRYTTAFTDAQDALQGDA